MTFEQELLKDFFDRHRKVHFISIILCFVIISYPKKIFEMIKMRKMTLSTGNRYFESSLDKPFAFVSNPTTVSDLHSSKMPLLVDQMLKIGASETNTFLRHCETKTFAALFHSLNSYGRDQFIKHLTV